MNIDPSPANNARYLLNLTAGAPISKLNLNLTSPKDFHFSYNFDEFKLPPQKIKISKESQAMLGAIGSSAQGEIAFPRNDGPDDGGYDRLIIVNGEVSELAGDLQKEEESGKRDIESDDSFELASGKKKNKGVSHSGGGAAVAGRDWSAVKAASKGKQKIPFHVPSIRKPQEEFNISVDNSNKPFNHAGLKKSKDGKSFIHPLEKLSVSDFVEKDMGNIEPMEPLSLDCTPFKLVEDVKGLKQLAAKLRGVNEFAVDLEHNQYRSFQGLTCLMQISTRTEDFVVDTLKVRSHVGPYLREVFRDPTKRKVMHGADRDIIWLQKDFGIYVCNMFDTGQASRVLKLERNSLEYLLHHFCGVTANKQYQNSDWRLRPLPDEMVRYGREDTHYLLYIYDLMRIKLSSMPVESGNADSPLLDVYKRSYDLCLRLYEKELLTEDSYLSIYGLQGAGLNAQQLAIVAGLYEWRDAVARAEDESTGYILPNKTLLEIAKQMPVTTNKLHRVVKSKHWYIERDLATVVTVIRRSMLSAAAFEAAAKLLRQRHLENVSKEKAPANDSLDDDPHDRADAGDENIDPSDFGCSTSEQSPDRKRGSLERPRVDGPVQIKPSNYISKLPDVANTSSVQITGTTGQALMKPERSFGALKRKFDTDKRDKEEIKLERIRSTSKLPIHSSLSEEERFNTAQEGPSKNVEIKPVPSTNGKSIIVIDDDSDIEDSNIEIKKYPSASVASTNLVEIIALNDDSDSDSDPDFWDTV